MAGRGSLPTPRRLTELELAEARQGSDDRCPASTEQERLERERERKRELSPVTLLAIGRAAPNPPQALSILYCWQPHHYSHYCCPPPPAPLRSHHHLQLYIPLAPPPSIATRQRFLCYAWLRPTRCLIHPVTHLSIHPADRTLLPPSLRHISARTSGFASRAYYTTHPLHTYTHTTSKAHCRRRRDSSTLHPGAAHAKSSPFPSASIAPGAGASPPYARVWQPLMLPP